MKKIWCFFFSIIILSTVTIIPTSAQSISNTDSNILADESFLATATINDTDDNLMILERTEKIDTSPNLEAYRSQQPTQH